MQLTRILGHDVIIDALLTAYRRDRLHHAYLFSGPHGVGKRTTALAFASLMGCLETYEGPREGGCGACRWCRAIDRFAEGGEGHPDLHVLEPDGRQIKIEQVRELLKRAPYPPLEAACRVVIIDPADAMNETAANALLKTLEEPSSQTRFILVTSRPDALLTTILSRCQRIPFGRLSDEQLLEGLTERLHLDPDEARAMMGLAAGSLGQAQGLLENPVMNDRAAIAAALLRIEPGDVAAAFRIAGKFAELKGAYDTIFDLLGGLYRDLVVLRTGQAEAITLRNSDLLDQLAPASQRWGVDALLHRVALIEQTRRAITERNINPRLAMERLVLDLTAAPGAEAATTQIPPPVRR